MAYKKDTICVQGGYRPQSGEARIPPIVQSTTFYYDSTQAMADLFDLKADGYFYTRLANPTVAAFEGKVAELEGGVAAIGCASGMSAIMLAAFTLCGAGDNIVSSSAIYGGSFNLFSVTLPKLGIQTRFFDPDDSAEEIEKLIDGRTKLIYTETVANPSIKIIDFEKIAALAKKYGIVYADDNTLATPVLCRPFEWGANIVLHSSSKYLDGHAAALGGVIVDGGNFNFKGNKRYASFNEPDESYHGLVYADLPVAQFATKCRAQMMRDMGAIMSPQNAFLSWLGCDTLALRMERHSSNAAKVAAYLAKHPKIDWVLHASLPDNKYHALAQKYMPEGTGGMLSFGIKGDVKAAAKFMEALQLITQETHVADARSCILHPASTTHRQLSKEELAAAGVPENLVRLSVGIENPDDILADIEQALAQI
ncbi:MAG TPA: O-acetylhomoserine aminocarboxypropyltransferase/cysteine synthase [Candidatus Borkfalkia excrementigallinarum]|uniref:homocysteine desulfhydrase n=1 Tax=Candidatus Borkfalkia excrementigallinarum TaxID=2838506 RepID=A0A9D1ZV71_9FIRM|nr:O-acetylhomoserine aminocarboxypropyltransferase/cysteine synthase [Candidatus Borkfalkia excrementigallinarum]